MELRTLLAHIVSEYRSIHSSGGLGKTRLIKLAYLCEVFYARGNGKRLTDTRWVFHLYGPYVFGYDDLIARPPFSVESEELPGDREIDRVTLENESEIGPIDFDLSQIVRRVVKDFGSLRLNELLDYVYFETEPMMEAEQRGKALSFDSVRPEAEYKIKQLQLDKRKTRAILADIRKRSQDVE